MSYAGWDQLEDAKKEKQRKINKVEIENEKASIRSWHAGRFKSMSHKKGVLRSCISSP